MSSFEHLRNDIKRGDVLALREFLAQGGDPNVQNERGESAVAIASAAGQTPIVELLLAAGADVNSQDHHGHTPLLFASIYGHERTARVLLEHGADPQIPASGSSIVGWLVHYGEARSGIVELLKSWGRGKAGA